MDSFENLFSAVAVKILVSQIDENQVDISSARDDLIAEILQSFCESLCVQNDLFLVLDKFLSLRLPESNCNSSNRMIVRSALKSRKERFFNWLFQIVAFADSVENHSRASTSKGLVSRSCDNVAVFERSGDDVSSYKAGNMRHIGVQ